MTLTPQYTMPAGTEMTLHGRTHHMNARSDGGYDVVDIESGERQLIPFSTFVAALKARGTKLVPGVHPSSADVRARLEGFETVESLSQRQRKVAQFHHALCKGMEHLRDSLQKKHGKPGLDLSIRMLDKPAYRRQIREVAQFYFDEKIRLQVLRGGCGAHWIMYNGRTLQKYLKIYQNLPPDVDPLAALVCRDDRKGNRELRLNHEVCELITQAWEKVGLDLKKTSLANVRDNLETLISEKNTLRQRNELPPLVTPAAGTVKAHCEKLVSPTAYEVATMGERHARNKRGRGSTDIRALMIGEYVEIDECKISLVTTAKKIGLWATLSSDHRAVLRETDEEIKKRWQLLYAIDVASRMPLAWVIAENQGADATMALLRMATRDKKKEAQRYGCTGEPMPAIGLGNLKSDNGTGLRNQEVIKSLVGVGATSTIGRTYASTDKPYVERMFGTLESTVMKTLHGYTGRRAGELPGYDATSYGVLNVEQLYGILTRYFIDEYPSTRHYGTSMWGRRPIDVFHQINRDRGCFAPIDPNRRRIQLGWEAKVTPTDEGVRTFSGIWFNSDELQRLRDKHRVSGKVSVFVDPDDMNTATVVLPKIGTVVEVYLQITALADLTLVQILDVMAQLRKENQQATEVHEDRIMQVRRARHDLMQTIAVEKALPRSYVTMEEANAKAKAVIAGAKIIPNTSRGRLDLGVAPDAITDISTDGSANAYKIEGADQVVDETATSDVSTAKSKASTSDHVDTPEEAQVPVSEPETQQKKKSEKRNVGLLGRPDQIKDLE